MTLRDELAALIPDKACCRSALLAGLTASLPPTGGRLVTASVIVGALCHRLAVSAGWDVSAVPGLHGMTLDVDRGGLALPRARCCRRVWLRGTFLVSGTLTDPHKGYNLEWAGRPDVLDRIAAQLAKEAVRVRQYERTPGHWVLFCKNAGEIGTVLAAIGATKALLGLEDVLIERDLKNQVHRRVNYETANWQKTVDTGLRQADEFARMREQGLLDSLPDSLRQAAALREKYPYASLQELCALANPPLSKSGLNHRLRKLHAIMRAQWPGDEPEADPG